MTREEAREYFEHHIRFYCVTGVCREAEEMAIKALEQEPKTGHWIEDAGALKCSECGKRYYGMGYDYCPKCGTKMFEPQESEDK